MRSTCRSFPRRCGMVWRRSGITRRLPPRRGKSCSGFSGPSSEREGEGALAAGQAARRPALAAPVSHGGWACEELDQDDARDETADVRPESPRRLAQILRPRRADEANVMRSREAPRPEGLRRRSLRHGPRSTRLEYLLERVGHQTAADATLSEAAEARDLISEDMTRVHDDGAVRDGKKAGDGLLTVVPRARVEVALDDGAGIAVCRHQRLLQDVGRLALDDGSHPEEVLLHVGVHSLWIAEQQGVEPRQELRQVLGRLGRLAQIAREVTVDAPAARVGLDAGEPR